MRNPFRDEAAAFALVLATLVAAGLIVLASWISTWLGIIAFLLVLGVAAWALRGSIRQLRPPAHVVRDEGPSRRILVVANETVGGTALLALLERKAAGLREDVLVVCPALNSRLRTWTSDEDGARDAARARLDASVARLTKAGVRVRGEIGDGDPLQALEDALRTFPADEIVISTHPPGRSHWLEHGVVRRAGERFDVPVTHVVVGDEPPAA